jgi:hypothetical protein
MSLRIPIDRWFLLCMCATLVLLSEITGAVTSCGADLAVWRSTWHTYPVLFISTCSICYSEVARMYCYYIRTYAHLHLTGTILSGNFPLVSLMHPVGTKASLNVKLASSIPEGTDRI